MVLSVIFSTLSYFMVENPIRFSKKKQFFYVLLVIMFLIGAASVAIYKNPELIRSDDFAEDF